MEHETFDFDREYRQNGLTLIVQGLTSQSTQFRSFRRWCFTGLMTQPTALKHWRSEVISHSDRLRSNQAHLTMLHWCNMRVDIIQENNLRHTKWCKDTEWTQWDEAKSGRQNLWAAQMTVQLYKGTQYREQFWQYSLLLSTKSRLRCGQTQIEIKGLTRR